MVGLDVHRPGPAREGVRRGRKRRAELVVFAHPAGQRDDSDLCEVVPSRLLRGRVVVVWRSGVEGGGSLAGGGQGRVREME